MKRYLKQILAMLLIIVMAVPVLAYDGESYCENCGETCPYTLEYEEWGKTYHCIRWWCSNCGGDMMMGGNAGVHHFEHDYDTDYDVCEECGYEIDCECGEAECDHYDTYTEWDDCDWYEYCSDCDELLDEGTEHGDYQYDDWEYYTSSKHRRYYYCEVCGGDDGYETDYHDTDIEYNKYDSTRHEVIEYCYDCDSEIDAYYENHSLKIGAWTRSSDTQHSRLITCSDCGYSTYEYADHTLTYGAWTKSSGVRHSRTVKCTGCSFSATEYANHTMTTGDWKSISSSQHSRTSTCVCGYSTTETGSHDLTYTLWAKYSDTQHSRRIYCSMCEYDVTVYDNHAMTTGKWTKVSDTQHSRTSSCSCGYSTTEYAGHDFVYGDWIESSSTEHERSISCTCGYLTYEYGEHEDADGDGYCDECYALLFRFSVTVPAMIVMAVGEDGYVFEASNAAIINNSSHAVEITSVSLIADSGWTIVPFDTNMADEKVDSKLIGFYLNDAVTTTFGDSEELILPDNWTIDRGSAFRLYYHAMISATSDILMNEQVLTLVFVIDWAPM